MTLENPNQPPELYQIFSLPMANQIKLIKKVLVKYVLHGKLIHLKSKEMKKIQEIL
jgi:hypothetical protein